MEKMQIEFILNILNSRKRLYEGLKFDNESTLENYSDNEDITKYLLDKINECDILIKEYNYLIELFNFNEKRNKYERRNKRNIR